MIQFGLGQGEGLGQSFDLAMRSSLVLVIAWLVTIAMRRRSAAARHLVWSTAMMGVLALPAAQWMLPGWHVLPTASAAVVSSMMASRSTVDEPAGSLDLTADERHEFAGTLVAIGNVTDQAAASILTSQSDPVEVQTRSLPHGDATASQMVATVSTDNTANTATPSNIWGAVRSLAVVVWLAGVVICCVPTLLGLASVHRLRRSSQPVPTALTNEVQQLASSLRLSRRIQVVLSSQREMPMTWGLFVPVLLLPAIAGSWSIERRRIVALHELAHIRRWDCLTQIIGQLARALHWFNPLAWLALQRLRIEQEHACDDIVLNHGTNAEDYAAELLSVTARLPRATWDSAVALAMSRTTRIERRLNTILDSSCERQPMSSLRVFATLSFMSLVALGMAAIQSRSADAGMPTGLEVTVLQPEAPKSPGSKESVAEKRPATSNELGFDNGDIEAEPLADGMPPSWFPAHLRETRQFVKFAVEESGQSGKRSVSITIDKTHPMQQVAYNWLARPRGWKPGQALEISAWVKTENVKTTPSLSLQCHSKDNKFLAFSTSAEKHVVTGTKDWTRISTLVLVPANTDQIRVRAALDTLGNAGAKVWFDDFAIAETNEKEAKAATKENPNSDQIAIQSEPAQNSSLKEVLEKIAEVSPNPVDPKALNEAAIRGMLQALNDPYSTLVTPVEMREIRVQLDGKLTGIGAALAREGDEIVVKSLLPGSPAIQGGLKPNDVIVEVNGQPAKEVAAAVSAIRGQAGTEVVLQIRRADKLVTFNLKRGEVRLHSVKGLTFDEQGQWRYWLDPEQKIAYVQLAMFDQETHTVLKRVLTSLHEQGMKGLVLDLRGNFGGILMPCVEVAKLFLKEGTIVEVRARLPDQPLMYKATAEQPPQFAELPVVLLIDGQTASAAEVLAAALKDNDRAMTIGERSFGKGSVQSILPVGNGGLSLKLTTAQMFSPSGQPLQRSSDSKSWGVDPQDGFFVPLTAEQRTGRHKALQARETGSLKLPESLSPEFLQNDLSDPQLAAAMRTLTGKLATGTFAKTGQPLADQQAQLNQRDELRKQRDELQLKLERLDRELGEFPKAGIPADSNGFRLSIPVEPR